MLLPLRAHLPRPAWASTTKPATVLAEWEAADPPAQRQAHELVQGRYVLGYPLHHSQRVLVDDGAEIRLSLRVYLTHELYMELLSYVDSVEVLAPESLREWLQQGHRAAAG